MRLLNLTVLNVNQTHSIIKRILKNILLTTLRNIAKDTFQFISLRNDNFRQANQKGTIHERKQAILSTFHH